MTQSELQNIISGCRAGNPASQKALYKQFYRYGMNVSHRYAQSKDEAEEMLNDAFLRVFTKIDMYDPLQSFPGWFHTIVIRSAINYLKKYEKKLTTTDLELAENMEFSDPMNKQISSEEVKDLVRQLPPSYRTAFTLSAVEGYSHVEIAAMLGIAEGTARTNMMIARQKLQKMILEKNLIKNG